MRVAIIENMKNTQLGALGQALTEAGAELLWFRPWQDGMLPRDDEDFAALVVMGGEQSAVDDERHPYLPALAAFVRRFGDSGRPVLGICLGSQILARAYGAKNRLNAAREFGWHAVSVTPEGAADPLLSAMGEGFTIFEWHADTFSLPEGAVRLATNDTTLNQAFRIGQAAYGTQFHFEADRGVIEVWKSESAAVMERLAPGWLAGYDEIAARHAEPAEQAGLAIARAWVRIVETSEMRAKTIDAALIGMEA